MIEASDSIFMKLKVKYVFIYECYKLIVLFTLYVNLVAQVILCNFSYYYG